MRKILLIFAALGLVIAAGACGKKRPADALDDNFLVEVTNVDDVAPNPGADLQARCASTAIYNKIKLELFRQAVKVRGRDEAAFNKIAGFSFVRMDGPVPRGLNQASGEVTCSGRLTLDLPPGLAVAGGGNRLGADIGYSVRPAANGRGEVVTVSAADSIIVPLATLARIAAPRAPEPAPPDPLTPLPDPLAPAQPQANVDELAPVTD